MGSITGLGRSSRGGHGNPLQYSSLENTMDRGTQWATVYRVTNNWTRLKRRSTRMHAHQFIESTDSDPNLILKHPHRRTQR